MPEEQARLRHVAEFVLFLIGFLLTAASFPAVMMLIRYGGLILPH